MNRKGLVTFFATALAVFSFACASVGVGGGTFKETDSGKTFTTSPGDDLDIRLKGNYTTGYMWEIVNADKAILKAGETKYILNQPQLVGAGGVQQFKFSIVGKGKTTLKIIYHRTWEKDIPPAQTFTLQVDSK